jgi:hypothetical protein
MSTKASVLPFSSGVCTKSRNEPSPKLALPAPIKTTLEGRYAIGKSPYFLDKLR